MTYRIMIDCGNLIPAVYACIILSYCIDYPNGPTTLPSFPFISESRFFQYIHPNIYCIVPP